jgi:predicted nucleic acid-binding protein
VKIVDANLLLYATDARSPRHVAARSWLERQLSGDETIAFAWVVLLAFVRLSTRSAAGASNASLGPLKRVVGRIAIAVQYVHETHYRSFAYAD